MSKPRKKRRPPECVLALPYLVQSNAAVLNTFTSRAVYSSRGAFVNASCRVWPDLAGRGFRSIPEHPAAERILLTLSTS